MKLNEHLLDTLFELQALDRVPRSGYCRRVGKSSGWQIGVRPENIQIASKGLAAEVGAVDYMGAETVLRLKLGSQNLMARLNGRASAEPGETVNIAWKAKDVHLFDENGIRRTG